MLNQIWHLYRDAITTASPDSFCSQLKITDRVSSSVGERMPNVEHAGISAKSVIAPE